jgi:uncharacterized protein (DUF2062 family)
MPKKTLLRFMPKPEKLKENPKLRFLGSWLHDPNIWHLNRRSAAGAFAVGLFMAFVPLPSQMLMAAFGAVVLRVNLPLSVVLVWISNPITMPPIFYFCYRVGALLLSEPPMAFHFELSWTWIINTMELIGPPFLLGCAVCGMLFSLIGYVSISQLWRYSTMRRYQQRKMGRNR